MNVFSFNSYERHFEKKHTKLVHIYYIYIYYICIYIYKLKTTYKKKRNKNQSNISPTYINNNHRSIGNKFSKQQHLQAL